MLSALLAAWLLPLVCAGDAAGGFAGLFVLGWRWLGVLMRGRGGGGTGSGGGGRIAWLGWDEAGLSVFCWLLVLYGGLETCLSGWLTTYALRYGDRTLAMSEYTTLLLWMCADVGAGGVVGADAAGGGTDCCGGLRWLMAVFLRWGWRWRIRPGRLRGCGAAGAEPVAVFSGDVSLLMGERPRARQAGMVMAVWALGAAALPWMMGVVSTRTGSLQVALTIPLAAGLGLLLMSVSGRRRSA